MQYTIIYFLKSNSQNHIITDILYGTKSVSRQQYQNPENNSKGYNKFSNNYIYTDTNH